MGSSAYVDMPYPNLCFSLLHHVSLKLSHGNILKNQLTMRLILERKNLKRNKIMCKKYARVYIHFKQMWNAIGSKHDLRV
jgi:hypothetical protein